MTPGAFSSQNDFVGSDAAKTRSGSRKGRDFEPIHIFDRAAFIADEMMVLVQVRVVPRSFTVKRKFAHQAGFHERVQRVVNRRPRRPRVPPVQSGP
jgi:hypothetical protein